MPPATFLLALKYLIMPLHERSLMPTVTSYMVISVPCRSMISDSEMFFPLCACQCDANNSSDCALYTFSSGVNAIQEWYRLHYMNIMAQIPLETKEKLSYSADDLILTCFFDGLSCDKRSVHRKFLSS